MGFDSLYKALVSHPLYEIVTTTAGAISIRHKAVNEIMHNPVGPWAEANALYIQPSRLKERLSATGASEPLVVWDVGLGAAANSVATLACARKLLGESVGGNESLEKIRPLHLVSFERDLDLLRFALDHADQFEHFRGFESAMEALLESGRWSDSTGMIQWELHRGDFMQLDLSSMARPHLIFFDPYSPKVNQDMWGLESFCKIRNASREISEGGTVLFTYSQATRIRVAMIAAGFRVGYGPSTGLKEETTQAATDDSLLVDPLGEDWFQRWNRSHIRAPFDCPTGQEGQIDDRVRKYFGISV